MQVEITLLRDFIEEDKLPPQAKVILTTLKDKVGVGEPMDRGVLIEELDNNGDLVTRQGAARVLTFYQSKFVEAGLVRLTRSEVADEEEEAPKPKKKAPAKAKAKAKVAIEGDEDEDEDLAEAVA